MADRVTDEVFAKIRLVPVSGSEMGLDDEKSLRTSASESGDKHTSFAKTLTQSDANNGGGFSVPRFCAETIFPSLDYNNDPPVQTIVAKDVHGETWKFRHIYRGTPRRHLLTTGWSIFVNHKSLVAGDSVVFMRGENSDVYLGIRRAPAPFVLFGKPILTDHQISQLCSNDSAAVSQTRLSNTCNVSGSCFDLSQNKEPPPSASPSSSPLPGLDGLCKVFLESEDVGRTLDLSSVDCYADVRLRLKDLFGIQVPETPNLIIYRDAAGTVRQLGDEPFCTFVRSARRLTVLTDMSTNCSAGV